MKGSHAPTLLTLAARELREHALARRGETVLVAVSGGPDSMALLHVLARLAPKQGFRVIAHGVDHGLREGARAELELAADLARSLDVPFATTRVTVAPGGNLQARARAARWDALDRARHHASAASIATAHHADDRAETVLLRLLRGTGVRGLAVLPPRSGDRIRPFLRATRTDVQAHLARHAIPFAVDPSNADARFARARARAELMPLLVRLSPRIVEHLCALADDALALRNTGETGVAAASLVQRAALARALATRNPRARVALSAAVDARVDLASGRIVTMKRERP